METPTSRKKKESGKSAPAAARGAALARLLGAGAMILLRLAGRFLSAVLAAIWKFIITTWRLASALDSALWRAIKLLARRMGDAMMHALALLGQILRSFVLWLPTRTGRAYSAVSGVVLVIALLWIADTLRAGPGVSVASGGVERAPIDEEDPILARIDARYVHLSEIEAAARSSGQLRQNESLTERQAFERGFVENYVEQRLLARAAQDAGIHRSPAILRRVNAARDRILAASLLQSELSEEITPETVQKYYDEQRKIMEIGDEVRARHILVETGAEAEEIVQLLSDGADFGALARERSQDRATAPLGGEIGWFSRAMMTRNFSRVAFSTSVDTVAAPFQTEYGWHVMEVTGRRPTSARPFSEVRDDIEEFLRLELIAGMLRNLEDENRVVYYRPETENQAPAVAPLIMPGNPGAEVEETNETSSE